MKSSGIRSLTIVAILAIGTWFPLSSFAQDAGDRVAGRNVARAWCANCHAFPGSTQATATGAPSFRAIASNTALTPMALRAFLQTPHDRMPDLHLNNNEMDDLIAFILSSRVK